LDVAHMTNFSHRRTEIIIHKLESNYEFRCITFAFRVLQNNGGSGAHSVSYPMGTEVFFAEVQPWRRTEGVEV
jgi:hypothetical protein